MNKSYILAGILVVLLSGCTQTADKEEINITPAPVEVSVGRGSFSLNEKVSFVAVSGEEKTTAEFFASRMRVSTGFPLPVVDAPSRKSIELTIQPESGIKEEGYKLSVSTSGVRIIASDQAGLFYGMESFLQLLPPQIENRSLTSGVAWEAKSVEIDDYPRFSYRGCHVDPCRHFRTAEWVKKQIDVLALYKINTVHFHLTEDQGWRVEIKKYPKLTELGSERICENGTVHKGFYTQEELRDLVAYAAERHIEIIPELEIPGHELAAIHAYPELSCRGQNIPVRQIWGIEDVVMCPGKGLMFDFLKDVIDELVTIFPSEIYHIGGDECPKGEWERCPRCQKMIRDLGLDKFDDEYSPEQHLQTWIVEYFEKYLAQYGKRIIGWDEILEGDLTKNAMVMSWRGIQGGIDGALRGNEVVMTPSSEGYYLDYYQGDPRVEPLGIGGYATLEKTYSYEPIADTLVKMGCEKFIKGVQGNCWAEYFSSEDVAEYRTYPRILAVAETGWTPSVNKNFTDFSRRVDGDAAIRMAEHDINYHIPQPEQVYSADAVRGCSCDHVVFTDKASLRFKTTRSEKMVYTTDGSEPSVSSSEYTAPLEFTENTVLKIRTVLPSGIMSPVRTINIEKVALTPAIDVNKSDLKNGLAVTVIRGNFSDIAQMEASPVSGFNTVITEIWKMTELVDMKNPNSMNFDTPQYGAVARGFIEVPSSGVYYVSSNLEQVKVDGNVVIDNHGLAKRFCRTDNSLALERGMHEIELTYLGGITSGVPSCWNGGDFSVRFEGSGEFMDVPEENLWHTVK